MSGSNLYAAAKQWASRPADERFWTLEDARDTCKAYADTATEQTIDLGRAAVAAVNGTDVGLVLPDGAGVAKLTHWSFGQLCRRANAPADYLRRLPAALASQCVRAGIKAACGDEPDQTKALVHANGTTVLRSVTSEKYTRFWNWEVFDRLVPMQADGWRVPPARPSAADDPRARPATAADCLDVRMAGLGIRPGAMIAPAGIYASDHDLFAFLVNENNRIDDGSDGGLSRGFFVSNSEVGAAALKVTCFHYRHCCSNHIVWDASNVVEISVRHVGDVGGRFQVELAGAVQKYLTASAKEETERVAAARRLVLGATKDEVLDAVFKALSGNRRAGLPSGINLKQIGAAYDLAETHSDTDGSPRTVWGYVNGMTRLSQQTGYADDRNFLDRAASAVLALAL